MGLFEDVVLNAKTAVNAVGKKAGQFVDASKLRLNAASLSNEISKRFEALGRIVYDSQKKGENTDSLVAECISSIDDLYHELDAVNDQIAASRSQVVCRMCGEENPANAVYCCKCGHKLQEEDAAAGETPDAEEAASDEPQA